MTDNTSDSSESTADVDSDGSTTTSQTRWWLTNDVLALWLVATFPVVIGADAVGILVLQDVPDELVLGYLAIVGTAVAWAFGRDAVAAWRQGE